MEAKEQEQATRTACGPLPGFFKCLSVASCLSPNRASKRNSVGASEVGRSATTE
jgi:hypothetical protein